MFPFRILLSIKLLEEIKVTTRARVLDPNPVSDLVQIGVQTFFLQFCSVNIDKKKQMALILGNKIGSFVLNFFQVRILGHKKKLLISNSPSKFLKRIRIPKCIWILD